MTPGLLSVVTFLPAVGAVALALVPRRLEGVHRAGALLVAVATLAVSIPLWTGFVGDSADFQFEEVFRWLPSLGVSYHVGIDGIVNGVGRAVTVGAAGLRRLQTGYAVNYALTMLVGAVVLVAFLLAR